MADFQNGTYLYIGDGIEEIVGHSSEAILEGGLMFIAHLMRVPEYIDKRCMMEQTKLYANLNEKKLSDLRFKSIFCLKCNYSVQLIAFETVFYKLLFDKSFNKQRKRYYFPIQKVMSVDYQQVVRLRYKCGTN